MTMESVAKILIDYKNMGNVAASSSKMECAGVPFDPGVEIFDH